MRYTKSQTVQIHLSTLGDRLVHDDTLTEDEARCAFAEMQSLKQLRTPPECPIEVLAELMMARAELKRRIERLEHRMEEANTFKMRSHIWTKQQRLIEHHVTLGRHVAKLQREMGL